MKRIKLLALLLSLFFASIILVGCGGSTGTGLADNQIVDETDEPTVDAKTFFQEFMSAETAADIKAYNKDLNPKVFPRLVSVEQLSDYYEAPDEEANFAGRANSKFSHYSAISYGKYDADDGTTWLFCYDVLSRVSGWVTLDAILNLDVDADNPYGDDDEIVSKRSQAEMFLSVGISPADAVAMHGEPAKTDEGAKELIDDNYADQLVKLYYDGLEMVYVKNYQLDINAMVGSSLIKFTVTRPGVKLGRLTIGDASSNKDFAKRLLCFNPSRGDAETANNLTISLKKQLAKIVYNLYFDDSGALESVSCEIVEQ